MVYDPNGGFVTGGGWIDSPAVADASDAALRGKVTFGFGSKYQKGTMEPQGSLEVQLHPASMSLPSTAFQWLVVAGSTVQFKGEGTIQNRPGGYGFLITALDGSPDQFRIKIWNQVTGAVVYDNMLGEAEDSNAASGLGGGSIVIHNR